jgi:hypothetical protein
MTIGAEEPCSSSTRSMVCFRAWRRELIGTYEFKDGKIIKNNGPWRRATEIPREDLQEWLIIPEMGFDVVILKKKDGQAIAWIDTYGDLEKVLGGNFPGLEHQSQ